MRTNKPVVAPKRLPQNEGEVSHWLSAHQERWDPGRSTGRSTVPRSPPRWTPERGSHTHLHDENFQCRSGCWGGLPRIESSTKEQKGLNDIYRWNHNDDWSMTELFNFLEMFNPFKTHLPWCQKSNLANFSTPFQIILARFPINALPCQSVSQSVTPFFWDWGVWRCWVHATSPC